MSLPGVERRAMRTKHLAALVVVLPLLATSGVAAAAGTDVYVAQTKAGAGDGSSCAAAEDITWLDTSTSWGGAGGVQPGTTVHLCGTISSPIFAQGSGTAAAPITLLFEAGAKMSAPTWTTAPSQEYAGAIQLNGVSYIVVD